MPFRIRRTVPLAFSNIRMSLWPTNFMLVGILRPSTTFSTRRFGSDTVGKLESGMTLNVSLLLFILVATASVPLPSTGTMTSILLVGGNNIRVLFGQSQVNETDALIITAAAMADKIILFLLSISKQYRY